MTWFDIIKSYGEGYTLKTRVFSYYLMEWHKNGMREFMDMENHIKRFMEDDDMNKPPLEPPELLLKFQEWKITFNQQDWKDRIPSDKWRQEMDNINDAIQALKTGLVGER